MKERKITALGLVLALILCLMTGCAGESTTANTKTTETSASSVGVEGETPTPEAEEATGEEPADTTEEAQEPQEEVNTPEKVNYELPIYEEPISLSVFYASRIGDGGTYPDRATEDAVFWYRVGRNLGYDLTFNSPGQAVALEQYNLMCASGSLTDIIFESMVTASSGVSYTGGYDLAIEDEVYMDLDGLVEEYAPNYYYYLATDPSIRQVVYTDDGNLPAFFTIKSEATKSSMGLAANADLMDAAGIQEAPDTIEGWMEAFAALKSAGCQYPCDVDSEGGIMSGAFGNAIGSGVSVGFVIDIESGELVFDATTDQAREYIEVFRQCYTSGWIDPDFTSLTGPTNPNFNTGNCATMGGMANQLKRYYDRYGINLEPIPIVHRSEWGTGQVAIDAQDPLASATSGVAISATCSDVEAAMRLLDWFYSDEGALIANYGWVEGETYDVVDGQRLVNDFYDSRHEATSFSVKSIYTSDSELGLLFPNISYDVADDYQKAAMDMWETDYSMAIYAALPGAVRLNSDESESLTGAITDLETYVESTVLSWMTCESELNDDTWADYLAQCEAMRLSEIKAGYEAAYERYLNK